MTFVKFTGIKSIATALVLMCAISLLLSLNSSGSARYVVQVAASKTPIDIQDFSKKNNISELITEVKSDNWYRYMIGNFDDFKSASQFASTFSSEKGIQGVFPRKLDDSNSPEQKTDTINRAKKPSGSQATTVEDSIFQEQSKPEPEPAVLPHARDSKPKKKSNYLFLRIFGDKNVIEFKKDLIVYANNHFPLFFRKFYIRVVEKTYLYPVIIFFIMLIFIFILNIILVLLVLYFTNQQKNSNDRQFRIYSNMYEMALRSYVFGEISWEKALAKLKRIKKPANRKILTSVLFNFQENLRGEMNFMIPEIFVKLGLHTDARNAAKSSFYYNQVMGIRELTNLYPQGANALVRIHINNPNDLVRAEAQVSYVRLNPDNPFGFFRTLTTPFTRWTQLSAFYLFRLHQLPVPAFVDFLDSEHPNVRNFSLRMIIYFQQIEHASEIFRMLESPMELTRFLAVKAINDLRLFDGKALIKNIYPTETGKNRIEIIKTIKTIGNIDDFEFLESIIRTGTVSEKTEACRSMYYVNNEGRDWLKRLNQQSDPELEPYIAHVTEPRN